MGLLARGEAVLAGLLRGVVGAFMLGAVGVNLANIIGRYVFARPFIWARRSCSSSTCGRSCWALR
jgi:hypothetical protein